MNLTPRELDKLNVYVVADLARRRRDRGTKLNYTEAVALITESIFEDARDGLSVAEASERAKNVVEPDEVMNDVPEMVDVVQAEATFVDGTKLVTVYAPIGGIQGDAGVSSTH